MAMITLSPNKKRGRGPQAPTPHSRDGRRRRTVVTVRLFTGSLGVHKRYMTSFILIDAVRCVIAIDAMTTIEPTPLYIDTD